MTHTERFAPSPTGPLHLGHAYSAILAWNVAQRANGRFLVRIEDIDQSRARPAWEAQIFDDLRWLGLDWEASVLRQNERADAYREALTTLWNIGLLYPCTCSRRDILASASAPQEGDAPSGPDGIIYPGTCRNHPRGTMPEGEALRLNLAEAAEKLGNIDLHFTELGDTPPRTLTIKQLEETAGDIVVARKNFGTSYHLSVVVDDAFQQVTHVTRGADLQDATPIHVLLQKLLELPTPTYHHHPLIRDADGKRLAKRDDARAIATYRNEGASPDDIFAMIGLRPLVPK